MNLEIGSFIGLDLRNSGEYFQGKINIARLNSARAGIYHSCRVSNCNSILIPYYLCPTVKKFLSQKGIEVNHYCISNELKPIKIKQKRNQAVLLVNYFGIMSINQLRSLAEKYNNVIIDNSAAFYCDPVEGCYNIYSPRKFFGVPDGCYVIGNKAEKFTDDYDQDFSSGTALFLLQRIELGTNATYSDRMKNEERIDNADVLKMSNLTRALLNNIDYLSISNQRSENFLFAHSLYKELNKFDPTRLIDVECIPMVYPLVLENTDLAEKLRRKMIYVGRLWNSVLKDVPDVSFEAWLSKYLIPIPIDQRYGRKELRYVYETIHDKKD
jgi:hypothetical protein